MSLRWPFLTPFLFMSAGLVFSSLSGYCCDVATVAALFVCLLLSSFLSSSIFFSLTNALFFAACGLFALQPWLSPEVLPSSVRTKASHTPVTIEGVITSRPSIAPEGSRLVVRVEHLLAGEHVEDVTGSVLLYVSDGDVSQTRGDRIRFNSGITIPKRLGLPGEFDYSRYLAFQGVAATCRVAAEKEIVLIRAAAEESLLRTFDWIARTLGDSIRNSISDERVSSVLAALLIGDQRRIPAELADAYTRGGVNHILSISGFHVGIIAAFITVLIIWLLTRFEYLALRCNVRRIALLCAVPVMISYLFLTGGAPATARSVIMLSVFAAALIVERERDSINTLLLAAFFLIAINPPTLFDVSFQLSFLSLWGILVSAPAVVRFTATIQSLLLRTLIQFIAVSAAASFATILPVLFIFKVASLNGILTNFIIVPLLGYGAVITGFIALPLIILFPSLAPQLLYPAELLVILSNTFITWCSSLPVIMFYGITAWDMLFFIMFMVCLTFVQNRFLLRACAGVIPVCAVILHIYQTTGADGRLHITMLSVGQAESLLVRLPDSSTLLVDGGGYLYDTGNDFGQRFMAPALGALHVSRIDRMIATHDHPDHTGGLPYLIRNFSVGEFFSPAIMSDKIQEELNKKKIPQRIIAAGDEIVLPGPVTISVLSPSKSNRGVTDRSDYSLNDQSLVFRLSYGSFSMLFTADAGFETESKMLSGQVELNSTVLKVGHHGSRFSTSEQFLERVHPRLALISAGNGNSFGLPSPRTVQLLRSRGIPLYRTDLDGTIEVDTDGVSWAVTTPYKPD